MSQALFAQAVALTAGGLLLTSILLVWRRTLSAATRLLALQGAALSGLVAVLAVQESEPELYLVAAVVLAVKTFVLPQALARAIRRTDTGRQDHASVNPVSGLLVAAALTVVAYLVSPALVALGHAPTAPAVAVGIAMVLIGFWLLVTRRRAVSQLVGFVVIDNGIATTAFLMTAGVPLIVELGVTLDVVLVVLILLILAVRMDATHGRVDLHDLKELHD
jgi:hydrogenase-4 component E